MTRPLRLIVNPSSAGGRSARILPKVVKRLQDHEQDFHTIFTRSLEHGTELAREGARKGYVVAAMGGDGLVGNICGAVASEDPSAIVGVIPAGRGNDFARFLGVGNLDTAVQTLITGTPTAIDLGTVNGHVFTTTASIGMDSDVIELSSQVKIVKGKAVYVYAALRALFGWQHATFTIETTQMNGDSKTETVTGYNVVVANSGIYGGGMKIAPNASPSDGLLEVVTVADMAKPMLLLNMPKVFTGRHGKVKGVSMSEAFSVCMDADRPLPVYADGELVSTTPAMVETLPHALRVLIPSP